MNTTNFHYTPHMTAVPTRLLLAEDLSPEAKLTGAILYAFDDGNQSYHALAAALNIPPEKIAPLLPNSPATAIWKFWKKTAVSHCT